MRSQRKATYDPARCQHEVYVSENGWPRYYQCSRKHLDGEQFCKMHMPDAIAERQRKSDARSKEAWNKRMMEVYGHLFFEALRKIADGDNNPRETAREVIARFESCK